MYGTFVVGQRTYGKKTQNAATVIDVLVEPWRGAKTVIVGLGYNDTGTAHTITIMRPLNVTTFSADAAAAQAVVNLTADPGVYSAGGTFATADNPIQASDYVVYEAADGTFVLDTVSSVASLAITLTTNLPTGGVKSGGKFWFFGVTTDTNPNDHQAHPAVLGGSATTTTTYSKGNGFQLSSIDDVKGLKINNGTYQPMIVHSNNATAAGTIQFVGVEYVHPAAVTGTTR